MPVIQRVATSEAIGAVDSPTELVDNNGADGLGPYQLLVTPGRDETEPAQIRLYEANRGVAGSAVDTDANLLERFDAAYDGATTRVIGVVPAGRKLWIATPDEGTSGHRATLDRVDITAI